MSKLKIIVLIALSAFQTLAVANTLPLPCKQDKWVAGIKALYLRPNFGGNSLGYSSFSNYGTNFFNSSVEVNGAPNHLNNIVPKRAWGYQLEAGYEFCGRYDVDINWYHFDRKTNGLFNEGTLFAGSASALYAGSFNIKSKWDELSVELGERFNLNPMNDLRLHAGLQFTSLQAKFTNYPQLTPTGAPVFITNDSITYRAFGPNFGADYFYHSCIGLGLYAKAAGSLLLGTAKQSVTGYQDLGGFNLYSTGNYRQSNNNVIVPELKANLGITYDHTFQQSDLRFDAGYMFVTYLGALVSQVGTGVVSSSISTSSSTNFNLNGPYLGVTWAG